MSGYITDIIARYEINLQKVKKNGVALRNVRAFQYVKKQTHELCLAAVQKNGWALVYVKEQTHELCLVALQQDVRAFQYVKKQTHELCLAALLNKCDQLNTLSKAKRESEIKIKCVIKFI